jgi:hypothetical protein
VLARHNQAYDAGQAVWFPRVGLAAGDLLKRMDTDERRLESGGVDLLSHTAPGETHVVLNDSGSTPRTSTA